MLGNEVEICQKGKENREFIAFYYHNINHVKRQYNNVLNMLCELKKIEESSLK